MEKNKDDIISKLNYINDWANDILIKSLKMIDILQSIVDENPDMSCCLNEIDIDMVKSDAVELLYNIDDAKKEIINEND